MKPKLRPEGFIRRKVDGEIGFWGVSLSVIMFVADMPRLFVGKFKSWKELGVDTWMVVEHVWYVLSELPINIVKVAEKVMDLVDAGFLAFDNAKGFGVDV